MFRTYCAQCHGAGAGGVQAGGYPSLLDNDWLWGRTLEDIHLTIAHGIRNETDPDARWSQMPAFGDMLESAEIDQVVNYVMSLSGEAQDAQAAAAGETVFMDNCAACHGDDLKGNQDLGAPNLLANNYTFERSIDGIAAQVVNPRYGVMPAWSPRLEPATVKSLAVYVHSLGGGE